LTDYDPRHSAWAVDPTTAFSVDPGKGGFQDADVGVIICVPRNVAFQEFGPKTRKLDII